MNTQPRAELEFGFLLRDVSRLLRRDFEVRVQKLGMTLTQWRAVAHLARESGISQAALADVLEVTPITLTRLIDRMEEAGWVERHRDPSDRRAVCLHLTSTVQPLLNQMHGHAEATHKAAFAGISQTSQRQMLQLLAHVKGNLLDTEATRKSAPEANS